VAASVARDEIGSAPHSFEKTSLAATPCTLRLEEPDPSVQLLTPHVTHQVPRGGFQHQPRGASQMASHPVGPSASGSRFPKTRLRVSSPLTRGDFRRSDSQPRSCDGQVHTHCSFAYTYPTPFRLTRTRLPCRGEQPNPATAQTFRRPRGLLRAQHGRCFFPTSATGSRHEHPSNRPTLACGSSPQPTITRATGSCDSPADSARKPGTTEDRVGG
jgi:hypothetical protein